MFKVNYYNDSKNLVAEDTIECITKEAAADIASIEVYDNAWKKGYRFFVVRDETGKIVATGTKSKSEIKFF